jgi:putative hydrolase of the HAD superfamily
MLQCVADFFHVSFEEAVKLRKKNLPYHSTTLAWLSSEGFHDPEAYFARVHPDNEIEELEKSPRLRPFLESLEQNKVILTNAPSEHAERVLKYLGVDDLFDAIVDVRACDLKGKPAPCAYEKALAACGGTVADTIFFDDQKKYTDGFTAIGGTAVLIGTGYGAYGQDGIKNTNGVEENESSGTGRTIRLGSIYEFPSIVDNG